MIKRSSALSLLIGFVFLISCSDVSKKSTGTEEDPVDSLAMLEEELPKITLDDIIIEKDLLYDKYTLEDTYPYKDTVRVFQWDKIKEKLFYIDSIQMEPDSWAILRNYKNQNGESPTVRNYVRDEYKRVADTFGVERYQSVALFLHRDSTIAERYGRDGSLVKILEMDTTDLVKIENLNFDGEWFVNKKYIKPIGDTIVFKKAIFVDRNNQNIATMEKVDSIWYVRSMNPVTTGLHNPPYGQETPLGIFVLQEQKSKMIFLKDGSTETGGFAPWASRFCNGAYLHGVPVNAPRTAQIEYSQTLGTTPRSHMCVRNVTSHAKFIYDWAQPEHALVFIIE